MPIDDHALTKAVERYLKRTKAPRWQLRDLRRTWKSLAAAAGVDRFTRDLIQQHAMNDTGSRHYDRADYLPQKRAALKLWSDYLEKILESPETRLRLCGRASSADAIPAATAGSAAA
jgi:integrase